MSKNSSQSSSKSLILCLVSEDYNQVSEELENRIEELELIIRKDEYKKYLLDRQLFNPQDHEEDSFTAAGILICTNKDFDRIENIISERIHEVIEIEKFTEEEMIKINQDEFVEKEDSKEKASSRDELQLNDQNLEQLRVVTGRDRYYQRDNDFFAEINNRIDSADKNDISVLSKIFTNFLNEFNDDLNGDDLDVCAKEVYEDLMRLQQSFIFEMANKIEEPIRQKVFTETLASLVCADQENFISLVDKPIRSVGCGAVLDALEVSKCYNELQILDEDDNKKEMSCHQVEENLKEVDSNSDLRTGLVNSEKLLNIDVTAKPESKLAQVGGIQFFKRSQKIYNYCGK